MKFEPGTLAVGVAILIFYLRMAMIRGRKRKLRSQEEAARIRERMKAGSKGKKDRQPPPVQKPNYEVGSWWVLGIGAVVALAGLALFTATTPPLAAYRPYWWAVISAGILIFTFGIK